MDSAVWRNMPEDLLDRTLACLPLRDLFRARAVCRRWHALIFSRRFVRLVTETSAQRPWLVLSSAHRDRVWSSAYDPASRTWHDMAVHVVSQPDKCVIATPKGLLCYGSEFFPWPATPPRAVAFDDATTTVLPPPTQYTRLVYQEEEAEEEEVPDDHPRRS